MASSNPPIKARAFTTAFALQDMTTASLKANPTLAAGDVQVSKDFGTFTNIVTLPVVTPALSTQVLVTLSSSEMTADVITIQFIDQTSPKEWADLFFTINTTLG